MVKVFKYKKEYAIKSHEADCHGFLRISSLMNILQDMAAENADILGLGFAVCHENNLAWVGSNYLIKIQKMPLMNEKIVVQTWPAEAKLWGAIRDFEIRNESGEVIITASSQWVLVDYVRHRPVLLKKYFPNYEPLNERVINTDFPKMKEVSEPYEVSVFKVRFDDIDLNRHVNNAVYPVWASESVDKEFRMKHTVREIELAFKKEAVYGEKIEVLTQMSAEESLHTIRDCSGKDVLAICRIVWSEITSS